MPLRTKTGQVKSLGDVNSSDLAGDDGDLVKALTKAAKGADWLTLGPGSAEPNGWT